MRSAAGVPVRSAGGLAALALAALALAACIPPGNSTGDAGTPAPVSTVRPSVNVMRTPFADDFARSDAGPDAAPAADASPPGDAGEGGKAVIALVQAPADDHLGPDWTATAPGIWKVEDGRLCGSGARNRGVWLNRTLPVNARIEFDAVSYSPEGDIKTEVWGDGKSYATGTSYTNATSYLAILGGWKNTLHVLARVNEHGGDRKVLRVDPASDDPRERPVNVGQTYRFRVERTDGHTVRWSVDGQEYLSYDDPAPLAGAGHDHFGFNVWDARVCFDNVKVTPL